MGNHALRGLWSTAGTIAFRLMGLVNKKIRLERRRISVRVMIFCSHRVLSDSNNILLSIRSLQPFLNSQQRSQHALNTLSTRGRKTLNYFSTIALILLDLCVEVCFGVKSKLGRNLRFNRVLRPNYLWFKSCLLVLYRSLRRCYAG